MKLKAFLLFMILFTLHSFSQCPIPTPCNLVLNGDFEQNNGWSTGLNQIALACNWIAATGSPEYYHANSTSSTVKVPTNLNGTQYVNTAFGGNAYAGIEIEQNTPLELHISDLLATQLRQPLQPNTSYQL
ncbi:MAG TPA: hypothetical protein VLB74_00715 [Flavobacterium sp.]|uniref:hypothetical protein n=1 Tax=Flavobacterium sp. TaxID=239 RepID=UPI002C97F509|nr:hypothetical protein [Flavobacterium sp.]HSD13146.1 hypothetical protein [Flavobacterium sp.]